MLNIIQKRNFENIHSLQKNLISTNLKKKHQNHRREIFLENINAYFNQISNPKQYPVVINPPRNKIAAKIAIILTL